VFVGARLEIDVISAQLFKAADCVGKDDFVGIAYMGLT
jgi:hypothetical protein